MLNWFRLTATIAVAVASSKVQAQEVVTTTPTACSYTTAFEFPVPNTRGPPALRLKRYTSDSAIPVSTCAQYCLHNTIAQGAAAPCVAFSTSTSVGVCQIFAEAADGESEELISAQDHVYYARHKICPEQAVAQGETEDEGVVRAVAANTQAPSAAPITTTTTTTPTTTPQITPTSTTGTSTTTSTVTTSTSVTNTMASTTVATSTTTWVNECGEDTLYWFEAPAIDFKGQLALRVDRFVGPETATECADICAVYNVPVCTAFSYHPTYKVCQIFESNGDGALVQATNQQHFVRKAECFLPMAESGSGSEEDGAAREAVAAETVTETETEEETEVPTTTVVPPTTTSTTTTTTTTAKVVATTQIFVRPPYFAPPRPLPARTPAPAPSPSLPDREVPKVSFGEGRFAEVPEILYTSGDGVLFESEGDSREFNHREIAEIGAALAVLGVLLTMFFVWVYREHYPELNQHPDDNTPLLIDEENVSPLGRSRETRIPLLTDSPESRRVNKTRTMLPAAAAAAQAPTDVDDYHLPNPGWSPDLR